VSRAGRALLKEAQRFCTHSDAYLPWIFLPTGLILGLVYAFLVPPLQVPDEDGHWFRAYGVSTGECIAPERVLIPDSMRSMRDAFPPHLEARGLLVAGDVERWQQVGLRQEIASYTINTNAAIYSCVPYIPAAAATAVGRRLSGSPLALLRLGRIANLLVYVFLTFLALRLLPGFRLLLFVLALVPMALHQAASLSADALTISSAFLFYAYVFHLGFGDSSRTLTRKQVAVLVGLAALVSSCKFNVWILLFTALIPAARCGGRARLAGLVATTVVAGFLTAAAWQALNERNLQRFEAARQRVDIYPARNALFLWQHPGVFALTLERTVMARDGDYLMEFVGRFGWLTTSLPLLFCAAYVLWLFVVSTTTAEMSVRGPLRVILLLMTVGAAISVFGLLWVLEVPSGYLAQEIIEKQRGHVPGVQGRYFIPIAFPFFVMTSRTRFRLPQPLLVAVSVVVVAIASILGYRAISRTYYLPTNAPRSSAAKAGIFRGGRWIVDSNNNGKLDEREDHSFSLSEAPPDGEPVAGDWTGDGRAKAGLYRGGTWYLDADRSGSLRILHFGGVPGDIPVVGDWNGDGRDKVGVFRQGFLWILDLNGDGKLTEGVDAVFPFGGIPGDKPVVGRWNGGKVSQVGIYRNGAWLLDADGDRKLTAADPVYHLGGLPNDVPVPGDWAGDGRSRPGIYRQGLWILDLEGDGKQDRVFSFGGLPVDRPVAGNW